MATPSLGPTKVPRCVIVTLVLRPDGTLACSPDPFHVSKGKRDDMLVLWQRQPEGKFSVDFNKNGCPFHESHFDQDNPCSGLVKRTVQPSETFTYEYTVTIDGKAFDPGGRVDP